VEPKQKEVQMIRSSDQKKKKGFRTSYDTNSFDSKICAGINNRKYTTMSCRRFFHAGQNGTYVA